MVSKLPLTQKVGQIHSAAGYNMYMYRNAIQPYSWIYMSVSYLEWVPWIIVKTIKNEYKIDPMLVTYVGDEIGWWELLGEI